MKFSFKVIDLCGFLQALASLTSHQNADSGLVSSGKTVPDLKPTRIVYQGGIVTVSFKPCAHLRKEFLLRALVKDGKNGPAQLLKDYSVYRQPQRTESRALYT